jgi:autotransporter-associated beta strand protein
LTFNGGTLQFGSSFNLANTRAVTLDGGGGTIDTNGFATTISQAIGGVGGLTKTGTGTMTLTGTNNFAGGTTINAGTLALSGAGTLGATTNSTTINGGTLDIGTTSQTQGSVTLNGGGLQIASGGALTAATITNNAGATIVANGTITGTLSNAGTLMGTGTIGNTSIVGGTFQPGSGTPGTSMTVNGTLGFNAASTYLVNVNPTTASFASVTGTATLGGASVNAIFANGGYISKRYTILTAGSVSGSFGTLTNGNLPANFHDTLSYDGTHAYLDLALNFTTPAPGGLNGNQLAVANALIGFFNSTGGIPAAFSSLNAKGLSQASGELGTGSQQTTFNAMNQFMGVLTDPFIDGRGDGQGGGTSTANGYASTQKPAAVSDAYAMFSKAPPAVSFEQRWSVWAAGYGGSQTTDGNAALGSNTATSRIAGTAVGADYRISPFTIAGFALAGGGTSFSVAGSGSGRSDLFQAGAFVRHNVGPAYISAALAYGWQDITTDRTVTIAGVDQLRARFNANAWSGRVEGGYRFVTPWLGGIGLTPYAAGQFTTFELPSYAEQVVSGANTFALAYGARSVTAPRGEIGVRTDKSWAMQNAILTLRGRLAWAYDGNTDRAIGATFQTLPGASFVVGGAAQSHDKALTTASAEVKWINGWSAAATFEGEFSDVSRSYAGKGVVRYQW